MRTIHTDILEIAFEDGGPEQGPPVVLLHGWPDAPRGWNGVASRLQARGWRTLRHICAAPDRHDFVLRVPLGSGPLSR
jgi:pimeloyl-ACP methyl ester carboxylesterase